MTRVLADPFKRVTMRGNCMPDKGSAPQITPWAKFGRYFFPLLIAPGVVKIQQCGLSIYGIPSSATDTNKTSSTILPPYLISETLTTEYGHKTSGQFHSKLLILNPPLYVQLGIIVPFPLVVG